MKLLKDDRLSLFITGPHAPSHVIQHQWSTQHLTRDPKRAKIILNSNRQT